MTHWKDITPQTTRFSDESYMVLRTPIEYLLTQKQKDEIDEKARRHRDMEESRRSQSMRPAN